jgi:hypothetical protein
LNRLQTPTVVVINVLIAARAAGQAIEPTPNDPPPAF